MNSSPHSPPSAECPGLIDSHAHLDMEAFDPDREEVVARAFGAGLEAILCPAELTKRGSLETVFGLGQRHPRIHAAAGVHPHQARLFDPDYRTRLRKLSAERRIAAVGEIGLDFHYNLSDAADQRTAFGTQLDIAKEFGLPVIVHSRNAGHEILDTVSQAGLTRGGVLHCFTETWDIAAKALDLGFFISFSGILTFPGAANLREIAPKVPAGRLLVETDSPYLAPVPYRGRNRRNEPAWVYETAKVLAGLRNESLENLAEATTRNFKALFSI